MAGTQLEGAHKAQIENRLVQLRVQHVGEPLQNSRAVVARRKLARHIIAHGLGASNQEETLLAALAHLRGAVQARVYHNYRFQVA